MKRPFHISLDTVPDAPVPFDQELSFSVADLDREPLLEISPVRIQGEVSRIEHGFALEAELSYGGRLECSRCLTSYPFQTAERFSTVLYKRPPALESEISLDRGDLDVLFYEEPEISLSPIAEERIQIAVPMKPLCREDCLGLCPNCGADRNTEECRCAAPAPDPRWDALRLISRND
jgi:DUF177 domain-containing protein